jgi:Sporulation and spore germination
MTRRLKIFLVVLAVVVAAGAVYLPRLARRVARLGSLGTSEELARREVVQPPVETPSDVRTTAEIFWGSKEAPGTLAPVTVELRLSTDPVMRAKQLVHELVDHPPSPAQRTLPAETALVEFYLLPNGIAVADFSEALKTGTPSGILSEQMAVDSIVRTLAANISGLRELKILIHGQEAETLAGHVDLTGYFALAGPAPADEEPPAAAPLTPPAAPGKLKP